MSQTREEILALPAGRVIDALIAEHLLGFAKPVQLRTDEARPWTTVYSSVPDPKSNQVMRFSGRANVNGIVGIYDNLYMPSPYSKEMAYAWPLFEGNGWILQEDVQCTGLNSRWAVFADYRALEDYRPLGEGNTAQLAICRAALIAKAAVLPTIEKGKSQS